MKYLWQAKFEDDHRSYWFTTQSNNMARAARFAQKWFASFIKREWGNTRRVPKLESIHNQWNHRRRILGVQSPNWRRFLKCQIPG